MNAKLTLVLLTTIGLCIALSCASYGVRKIYDGPKKLKHEVAVITKLPRSYPGPFAKTVPIWFNDQKAPKGSMWELLPGEYKVRLRPLIPGGFSIDAECDGHPGMAAMASFLGSRKENPELLEVELEFEAKASQNYSLSYEWISEESFYYRAYIVNTDKLDTLANVESKHYSLGGAKVRAYHDPLGDWDQVKFTLYGCR